MAYKSKGVFRNFSRLNLLGVVGVFFLVGAVAIGLSLANDPESVTFFSSAARKPKTFTQALQTSPSGQGFRVDGLGIDDKTQNLTIEGWFKLDQTPPLTHPEVLFKLGDKNGEFGAGLGSVVVYVAPVNAVNIPPHPLSTTPLGTLVIGVKTLPGQNGSPRGDFKLYDAGPWSFDMRDEQGNLVPGPGLFDNQWHHIALVISSNNTNQRRWSKPNLMTLYLDGKNSGPFVVLNNKPIGSETTEKILYDATETSLFVGADVFGKPQEIVPFQGQIDEVRFSKKARYKKDFTPSVAPFKRDGSVITLFHLDGSIVPETKTEGAVTVFGTPVFTDSFQ